MENTILLKKENHNLQIWTAVISPIKKIQIRKIIATEPSGLSPGSLRNGADINIVSCK